MADFKSLVTKLGTTRPLGKVEVKKIAGDVEVSMDFPRPKPLGKASPDVKRRRTRAILASGASLLSRFGG